MEETVPTIHTAIGALQYSECKKWSGRRFVAAALQQKGDGKMTKAASGRRSRGFSSD